MGARHHYVSRFHLQQFCDPDSLSLHDPWLWVGTISDGSIVRRAPKNVGTAVDLFDGPGGLADRDATLEDFLAREVEAPAALAIRDVCTRSAGALTYLPPALMRYLAWAASRSVVMQDIGAKWAIDFRAMLDRPVVEPPPDGLTAGTTVNRPMRLVHPEHDATTIPAGHDAATLLDEGWVPDMRDRENFLEMVHIQAYYFQVRWFPRLRWSTLRPPGNDFFVLSDRAVGWGVPECLVAPPCCLRDPSAFLIAPLSRSLALVGRNSSEHRSVTPEYVNSLAATWAHEWVVGPTRDSIAQALHDRMSHGS